MIGFRLGCHHRKSDVLAPFPKTQFAARSQIPAENVGELRQRSVWPAPAAGSFQQSDCVTSSALSSTKDVVVGKDGWLFYTADKLMEQHTGADVFTPAELENWVKWMEADSRLAGQAGHRILHPHRPGQEHDLSGETARLSARRGHPHRSACGGCAIRTLEFIDPREELFRAKAAGEMVYTPGDTHWSERGAFVAYQMLMDRMRKRYPSIVPLTLDDFEISYGAPAASDLTSILTLDGDITYTVERMTPKWKSHQTAPQTTDLSARMGLARHREQERPSGSAAAYLCSAIYSPTTASSR